MTPSSVSVPLLSPQRFLPPAEPKEFPATSDRVLSFHILDSLAPAPERQVQPIIRGESHTGDILSKVYQILWTGTAAGGNIFCNVASHILPSHCRTAWMVKQQEEKPSFSLMARVGGRPGWAFVWLLTLTSAPVKTIYCTYRGQESASNARKQQYGWYSRGLGPRGAQFGRSESGGSFPSFGTVCQMRVHDCIAVTPRDESLSLLGGGNRRHVKYVSWYLRRATLSGFTYRNSQWDGDSPPVSSRFHAAQKIPQARKGCSRLSLKNTKGVGDKKENLLFTRGKDSSFNTWVLYKTSTEDVFLFFMLYFLYFSGWLIRGWAEQQLMIILSFLSYFWDSGHIIDFNTLYFKLNGSRKKQEFSH